MKVKRVAYKFGAFMHWVFFKPTTGEQTETDPAQVRTGRQHATRLLTH